MADSKVAKAAHVWKTKDSRFIQGFISDFHVAFPFQVSFSFKRTSTSNLNISSATWRKDSMRWIRETGHWIRRMDEG